MVQFIEASARNDGLVDPERDRALVLWCQAGDSAAFAALYSRYEARLLRFCQRRLHDRQEAEDVTQEAFVRAWRAIPRFAGDRRFYPWLTVIARNLCTDALRKRSRTAPEVDVAVELESTDAHLADRQPTTEEQVLAAVDGELVHRALGRLSIRHRRVLELREGSEWSYKEIARFEGVEVSAIETLVWRARQALKREFEAVSGSAPSLGGFLLVGAGISRRWRALVARHGGILHRGGLRLRDAGMALVVTSAMATSAAIPSSTTVSAAAPPAVTGPSTAQSDGAPGNHGLTSAGGLVARGSSGASGDMIRPTTSSASAGTTDAAATGVTRGGAVGTPIGASVGSSPVATGQAPAVASVPFIPVQVLAPGTAAVPAATSAVASLGLPDPVSATVPGSASGIAAVVPGGIGVSSGTISTLITDTGIVSTSSTGTSGVLLGTP